MRAFLKANGANVAMMFGLALFPIAMATGAGIDFARAVMVHQSMNNALDAAALAVGNASPNANCASDGSNNATTGNGSPTSPTTCASYQQTAQQYFDQNYDHSMDATYGSPGKVAITVTSNANGQSVLITSTLPLQLTLLGLAPLFGGHVPSANVTASSTVVWGQTKLWVSLVLDNTGSMCQSDAHPTVSSCNGDPVGSKIAFLKSATTSLLTMLQNSAAHDGDVQVAIVPFVKDVNVKTNNDGSTNVNDSWIDWSEWDVANGSCNISNRSTYSSCINVHGTFTGTVGTCTISTYTSQNSCTSAHGSWTAASCSISGISSQSTCQNTYGVWTAASCNITVSPNTQSKCESTHGTWSSNRCNISGNNNKSSCQSATGTWTNASCSIAGPTSQSACTNTHGIWTAASCNISGISSQNTCTGTSGVWTWTSGTCTISTYNNNQSGCTAATGTWTHNNHSTWGGCVTDRGTDSGPPSSTSTGSSYYDVWNTAPTVGQTQTMFLAEEYSTCPVSVMSLSYGWTALATRVGTMSAAGGTNQPIGLAWGWQALSQGDPMDAPTLPVNTSRYIIILSDGLNTQDRWWGNGSDHSQQVDDRMTQVCTNAKADNVIIYAVYVDIGGAQGNSQALQNCASDSTKYFDLTSAGQISTAFNQIGQQITNLRVSR